MTEILSRAELEDSYAERGNQLIAMRRERDNALEEVDRLKKGIAEHRAAMHDDVSCLPAAVIDGSLWQLLDGTEPHTGGAYRWLRY